MPFLTFFMLTLLFFSGCTQPPGISKPSVVTFKTGTFRVHDTAFVTQRDSEVEIIVYTAGTPVLEISSGSMMCINRECLGDDEFIAKYLSPHYPGRLIQSIVMKKELDFEGIKTEYLSDGFIQTVRHKGLYDIRYTVKKREVLFMDRLNHIIIGIKDLD